MSYHIIFKTIGMLILLVALAMGLCLGIGSWLPISDLRHPEVALEGWLYSIGITLTTGSALFLLGRHIKGRGDKGGAEVMLRKEAVAIVGIGWLACSLHVSLPYLLCEPSLPVDKALFEGVSGLTTTGATVITDLSVFPRTLLLWRSVTQWIGGIGILAMFVLVLSGTGAGGRNFFAAESSLSSTDLTLANVRRTTRSLWVIYVALTLLCILGLWLLGMTPFQAVNHGMTTSATGGFGTENDSISSFGPAVQLWIIFFMVAGAISFPLYIALLMRRQWSDLKRNEEMWWFMGIFVTASVVVCLIVGEKSGEGLVATVFNVAAIATTTGYAVGDYDQWPLAGKEVLLLLMVIGGCAGSTAGGLKVSRFVLWVRFVKAELTKAFRPKVVVKAHLNGRPVPEEMRGQLFFLLTIAALVFCLGSLTVRLFEPHLSLMGCVSAVTSCLLNIGPAFAEFGPTKNFAGLSTPSTLFLPMLMIVGRLEYIAVLVLFSRGLWRRY